MTALLLGLSALAACGGSGAAEFTVRGRAACRAYAAQLAVFSRAKPSSPDAAQTVAHRISSAADASLAKLRVLEPPSSTGIHPDEWRRAIDAVRHDLRTADRFHAREYPRLLRSYYVSHPSRATDAAPTLAEAYDTPAGRRFLRLEQQLRKEQGADERAWLRLARKAGLSACSRL